MRAAALTALTMAAAVALLMGLYYGGVALFTWLSTWVNPALFLPIGTGTMFLVIAWIAVYRAWSRYLMRRDQDKWDREHGVEPLREQNLAGY